MAIAASFMAVIGTSAAPDEIYASTAEQLAAISKNLSGSYYLKNNSSLTLKVGAQTNLRATVEPEDATDKSVVWESTDPNTVSVTQTGKITAKAEGTATITVTTADGNYSAVRCYSDRRNRAVQIQRRFSKK